MPDFCDSARVAPRLVYGWSAVANPVDKSVIERIGRESLTDERGKLAQHAIEVMRRA